MTDTHDLDLANEVEERLKRHLPARAQDVAPLFATAVYNLSGARIGASLAAEATDGALVAVRGVIGLEQQDLILKAMFDNCLRSAATALDVCAAALFRIGGGAPGRREASLGQWDSCASRCPSLPQSLKDWINDTRASSEWQALNDARNQVTHSWSEHSVTVGNGQLLVDVEYAGQAKPVKDACREISQLGAGGFRGLVARIAAEYP